LNLYINHVASKPVNRKLENRRDCCYAEARDSSDCALQWKGNAHLLQLMRVVEVHVMEMSNRVLGAEHTETLTSMNKPSSTRAVSRCSEDEKRSGGKGRRILGDEHLDTIAAMNDPRRRLESSGSWTKR
jgi:hypothetical protein